MHGAVRHPGNAAVEYVGLSHHFLLSIYRQVGAILDQRSFIVTSAEPPRRGICRLCLRDIKGCVSPTPDEMVYRPTGTLYACSEMNYPVECSSRS